MVADETGVVFVPRDRVPEVVERVEAIHHREVGLQRELAKDAPLAELVKAYAGVRSV